MTITCPGCGKKYQRPPSAIAEGKLCCSMACRSRAARKGTDKTCERCGKTFSAFGKPKRRYCSARCATDAKRTGRTLVEAACTRCGKVLSVPPSQILRVSNIFCSVQCRAIHSRRKIATRCDHCESPYATTPNAMAKFGRRYCSHRCATQAKRNGEEKECPVCKARFWSQAHRAASNRGTFCSLKCYRVGSMTRPEQMVDAWLESRSIDRERQRRFKIGFVDFFVPDRNLVIEVDGDYWHSFPEQIAKDQRRDAYLTKIGLRVVRVRERDINTDIDSVMLAAGL
jgi:very-short-patch-repair endonuclease